MEIAWSNENCLEFLELYQGEPVLWDPRNKRHKNKTAVSNAWKRIQSSFSVQCTEDKLKKKKKSLMTTFRYHLNKKKASMKSGAGADEIYHTNWFAYSTMENFLAPIYECKKSAQSDMSATDLSTEDVGAESSNSSQCMLRSLSKIKTKPPNELITAQEPMDQAYSLFNGTTTEARKEIEVDECDLYGQLLAQRLKLFQANVRDDLMQEIDNIMYGAKRQYINPSVSQPTPPCPITQHFSDCSSSSSTQQKFIG